MASRDESSAKREGTRVLLLDQVLRLIVQLVPIVSVAAVVSFTERLFRLFPADQREQSELVSLFQSLYPFLMFAVGATVVAAFVGSIVIQLLSQARSETAGLSRQVANAFLEELDRAIPRGNTAQNGND